MRRRGVERPCRVYGIQIEIGCNRDRKPHSFQGDEGHCAPPGAALRAETASRQFIDAADDGLLHSSSSLLPVGQNQPISATAIGGVPQTTAHGVKIEPIKNIVVAIAVSSGQMLGSGDASRVCGSAPATELSSTSRRSTLRPATTRRLPASAHSGSRCVTTGIREKLYGGGGELVAHSSVEAPQGLSTASSPRRRLRITLTISTAKLAAKTAAPALESRFRLSHPISGV